MVLDQHVSDTSDAVDVNRADDETSVFFEYVYAQASNGQRLFNVLPLTRLPCRSVRSMARSACVMERVCEPEDAGRLARDSRRRPQPRTSETEAEGGAVSAVEPATARQASRGDSWRPSRGDGTVRFYQEQPLLFADVGRLLGLTPSKVTFKLKLRRE